MESTNKDQIKSTTPELSLDSVYKALETWRATKVESGAPQKIPKEIWLQIFKLSEQYSPSKLKVLLGISSKQYKDNYQALLPAKDTEPTAKPQTATTTKENKAGMVSFCEVKNSVTQLAPIRGSEPFTAGTSTALVELYRANGELMKIHMTTDRFKELVDAFCAKQ